MAEKERMETVKEVAKWGGLVAIVSVVAYTAYALAKEYIVPPETKEEPPVEYNLTAECPFTHRCGISVEALDDRFGLDWTWKDESEDFDPTGMSTVTKYLGKGYTIDKIVITAVKFNYWAGDNGWLGMGNQHYYELAVLGSIVDKNELLWTYGKGIDETPSKTVSLSTTGHGVGTRAKVGAKSEAHTGQAWTGIKDIEIEGKVVMSK